MNQMEGHPVLLIDMMPSRRGVPNIYYNHQPLIKHLIEQNLNMFLNNIEQQKILIEKNDAVTS